MKTSLSKHVVNQLPNVRHREQEGSGVIDIHTRIKGSFETSMLPPYRKTFENVNINALRAFEGTRDNYELTRALVLEFNHPHRHKSDALYFERVKDDYVSSLKAFNVCPMCENPIKTVSSEVVNLPTECEGLRENAKNPELTQVVRDAFKVKSLKRFNNFASSGSIRYTEAKQIKTALYAEVLPHYEIRALPTGKLGFVLCAALIIHGPKTEITVKRVNGVFSYYLGETPLEAYNPLPYRTFNQKCECKAQCRACDLKHSIHTMHKCKLKCVFPFCGEVATSKNLMSDKPRVCCDNHKETK